MQQVLHTANRVAGFVLKPIVRATPTVVRGVSGVLRSVAKRALSIASGRSKSETPHD